MSHYIAPRLKPLAHVDRLADWRRGEHPAPVTVEWDLTNVCSLGCQYCHFAHTHVAGPWATTAQRPEAYDTTGRFADFDLVRRGLREMADLGVRAIVWSGGGEPTLHPQVQAILELADLHGLEQGMYTLGGHVTESLARAASVLSWVVVSLDAPTAAEYAREKRVPEARFFEACAGVERLRQHVPVVGVSFLLHADNWARMDDMQALGLALGATYVTFRPAIVASITQPNCLTGARGWVPSALDALRRMAARPGVELDVDRFIEYQAWQGHGYTSCHGTRLATIVTPDGRVWICPNRRGLVGSELGDLRRESFAAIWRRHPGAVPVGHACRAMCRLHLVNQAVAPIFAQQEHEAFV